MWSTTRIGSWADPVLSVCSRSSRTHLSPATGSSSLCIDDTQICGFCDHPDPSVSQQHISTCVSPVFEWMQANCLLLNAAETELLWCASPQQQDRTRPTATLKVCMRPDANFQSVASGRQSCCSGDTPKVPFLRRSAADSLLASTSGEICA